MHHADDDLLSVRGDLIDLQPPVQEEVEKNGIVALLENRLSRRNALCSCIRNKLIEFAITHFGEQGQFPD